MGEFKEIIMYVKSRGDRELCGKYNVSGGVW